MKKATCVVCGKSPLKKNEVGINKKLIGRNAQSFYCIDCMADYLGVSVDDILDKIEEFKEDGCELFE